MKKIFIACVISLIAFGVRAQIANTKWRGTLKLDNPIETIFRFGTDTLEVINTQDNSSLETMKYSVQDSVLTIQKISGLSVCDPSACKYKFVIKGDEITFEVINDPCDDRSQVLNNLKLNREK
jgi:hypothetical protein